MAINYPINPSVDDEFTQGGTTWRWDGTAWVVISNISDSATPTFLNLTDTPSAYTGSANKFLAVNTVADGLAFVNMSAMSFGNVIVQGEGTASADQAADDLILVAGDGMNITVDTLTNTLTFDSAGGGSGDTFKTIVSDDGSVEASGESQLNLLGGANISTNIASGTSNVQINMDAFSINFLSDVDTTSSSPATGNVLKWDGNKWAPGVDATTGGAGTDADTLDGFDGSYYLDYTNFNNTPSTLTLASLSVGIELSADGDGAITYDNTSGEFRYTPPDLSSYLTSVAFSDLTSTPSSLSGYGITDSPTAITDLGITDGTNGQVLTTDGSGNFSFSTVTGGGGGGGITSIIEDTSPQLGGALDTNGNAINNASGNLVLQSAGTTAINQANITTLQLGSSSTYTLPGSDGSSGQVLSTNGTGQLSFTTLSSSVGFFELGEVVIASNSSGFNFSQIYMPAMTMFKVDNDAASAYLFAPHYSGNNPTIYLISGHTYAFDLSSIGGHPFEIQDSTGSPYNTGLTHVSSAGAVTTGSNAQGQAGDGVLYWTVPEAVNSPPNYRYQCTSHAAMVGAITIKDLSSL
jgi:hypothetical protein